MGGEEGSNSDWVEWIREAVELGEGEEEVGMGTC